MQVFQTLTLHQVVGGRKVCGVCSPEGGKPVGWLEGVRDSSSTTTGSHVVLCVAKEEGGVPRSACVCVYVMYVTHAPDV